MNRQEPDDIIKFLKDNVEPLKDRIYGLRYRASVYLTDGTFLPCVVFSNTESTVNLAIRRFKEERQGKGILNWPNRKGYYEIVKGFVTNGNCINDYDIQKVEKSKYAFPEAILRQIDGETTMGWTGFAAKMKDGSYVGFGTTCLFDFFQMPDNYSVGDIEEIVSHSYVLKNGELHSHEVPFFEPPLDYKEAIIYRERPFFNCYIDNL